MQSFIYLGQHALRYTYVQLYNGNQSNWPRKQHILSISCQEANEVRGNPTPGIQYMVLVR